MTQRIKLHTLLIKKLSMALGLWALLCALLVFSLGQRDVNTEFQAAQALVDRIYDDIERHTGTRPDPKNTLRKELTEEKTIQEQRETRRELILIVAMLVLMGAGSSVVVWLTLRGAVDQPLRRLVDWLNSINPTTGLPTDNGAPLDFHLSELQGIHTSVHQLLASLHIEQQRNRDLLARVVEVQERERASIAQELHDQLGQMLTSISVNSAFVARNTQHHTSEAALAIQDEAQRVMTWLRSSLRELKPHLLLDIALRDAILDLVDNWSRRKGWFVDFVWDDSGEAFGLSEKTAIYRVVQEALTNVAKHAESKKVLIFGGYDAARQEWVLIIDNDEVADGPIYASLGLSGIAERVQYLGGQLKTSISDGQFHLTARLPLTKA